MGRLIVRSKSQQKLREAYPEPRSTGKDVSPETSRLGLSLVPGVAKSKYASPGSTPGFEVLSRPKTANAIMDDQRRKRLMAMGDPISVTEGQDTFDFPTPIREGPQPQLMSKYANSPLALRPNLERSGTPDTIGIALGSPSHLAQFESLSPLPSGLYVPSSEVTPSSTPGLREVQEQRPDPTETSKQKVSRWRSVFGRKKPARDVQQQEEPAARNYLPRAGLGLNNYHTWERNSPRSPARLRSDTDPNYNGSPQSRSPVVGINRAQTAPTGRRNPTSPQPPPKDFLDIEIPSVKMERYSIMFNGILPNQAGGLLARRQSKRENANSQQQPSTLKDLDIPPVPRRRNTTTSPTASPSYRLLVFPPESSSSPRPLERKTSLLHRPRPLKRSNTAPGALSPGLQSKRGPLSPMSEASESLETESDALEITDTAPSTSQSHPQDYIEEDYKRDELDRQALTPTPSEPSTPNTPEDTHSMKSYNPFQDHARKASTNSWEEKAMQEPDWAMITIGKLAEPGDRFSGAQVRVIEEPSPVDNLPRQPQPWHPLRMNSLVNKNRPNLTSATMTTQPLPGKVEVQIARSMSVTKGQRARPVLRTSPRGVERGKGENLVVRTPLTPQVIEPASENTFAKGHKPMKSVSASIVDSS